MTLFPPNALKQKLAASRPALGFWLSTNSLAVTEMAAGAGWDWLLLDMEHVPYSIESVERHLLAAHHAGTDAELVVRIPSIDPVLVKRLMDTGVRSFMFPFVQTPDEARLAVAATRYPPQGIRGVAGGMRAARFGRDKSYGATYAQDVLVVLQIESPQAAANIPAYCAIDGVDALLIGLNDLAATMGHFGEVDHPEVQAAFDAAGRSILAGGRAAGFQSFDTARSKRLIADGFTLAAVHGDVAGLNWAMAEKLSELGR